MNTLFIPALHKSSGKTTVSVGLAGALIARGVPVQPFKKGPRKIGKGQRKPSFRASRGLSEAEISLI